jgi:GTP-binding protein HflX
VVAKLTQHRTDPHPGTYIGGGKIDELSDIVKNLHVDAVVINDVARSGQLFRLEQSLWPVNRRIIVWDRVGMILAIFDQHAKTREAKLQIELARIKHIGPRVYGLGGTVLSKQGAGVGTRGAGETNMEIEKRHIRRRVQQIEAEIAQKNKLQQDRMNDRRKRGLQTVALVGYTSAGKTTLFNLLTGREKEENAKLFTTLDSVVGKIKGMGDSNVLVSDTIGFIEGLPPELIQAFRSTLMESIQADVLLHVTDAHDPKMQEKITIVHDILGALPANQSRILVLNKVDLLTAEEKTALRTQYLGTPSVLVSAKDQEGLKNLKRLIQEKLFT